jgi:hypothetical protein
LQYKDEPHKNQNGFDDELTYNRMGRNMGYQRMARMGRYPYRKQMARSGGNSSGSMSPHFNHSLAEAEPVVVEGPQESRRRKIAEMPAARAFLLFKESVGVGGVNRKEDVEVV